MLLQHLLLLLLLLLHEYGLSLLCLDSNFAAKTDDFLKNKFLHTFNVIHLFKAEIELVGTNRLIVRIVPYCQIRVLQSLVTRDTLRRVE